MREEEHAITPDPAARAAAFRQLPGRAGDRLCQAPFAQLHFDPDGHVSVCSKSTYRKVGRVGSDELLAVWRGPALREIRAALASDRFPPGCEVCAWHLAQGNTSDHPAASFDGYGAVANDEWPAILEFAFSNLCNLACIQCSPELSSVLRRKQGLPPLRSPYGDRFFAEIEPFLEHAHGISLLGGEPFLQPECFRLLDALIAAGRRIPVHVTTNGTRYDERVQRVLDELPVSLAVSLDGVRAETIERIRVGAHADTLLANLRRFADGARSRGRPQRLTLNFCLLRENWAELPDLFLLAQELGAEVWVMPVTHPREHSVFTLPAPQLQAIATNWRERRDALLEHADESQRRVWEAVEQMVQTAAAHASDDRVWNSRDPIGAALTRIAAGELDRALAELEQLVAFASDDGRLGRAQNLRAWILLERGQVADAAAALADARALDADGTPRDRAGRLLLEAQIAARLDRPAQRDRAAAALVQLAGEAPESVATALPDGAMPLAWKLTALGLPRVADAVAACTPRDDRWYARALLFRANAAIEERDFAAAAELLHRAEDAGGRTAEWCLRTALLELWLGNVAAGLAATTAGERQLEQEPSPEPWLRVGLRQVHGALRRKAAAQAQLSRAT